MSVIAAVQKALFASGISKRREHPKISTSSIPRVWKRYVRNGITWNMSIKTHYIIYSLCITDNLVVYTGSNVPVLKSLGVHLT